MKKVVVLGNKEEEYEVLQICDAWKLDFQKNEWEVQKFFIEIDAEQTLLEIMGYSADLVICFNLAGFHIKMFGGDIFLNKLYCPIINVIWRMLDTNELELLNSRLNITIVFFINVQESVEKVKNCLEFPPYIQYVSDIYRLWKDIDLETVLLYGDER